MLDGRSKDSKDKGKMPERKEKDDSVLFALQELRRLEDDRVKQEQDEIAQRKESERQAKEAAARRARDEEAERIRAEEERVRRVADEKEAQIRAGHLRVEEAERRARVEGELKLKEQRLHLEMQARKHGKAPVKAIIGVVVVLGGVGGVIAYQKNAQHQQEQAALKKQLDEQREQARLAQAEYENEVKALRGEMDKRLKDARNEAERAKIRAEFEHQAQQAQAIRDKKRGGKKGSGPGTTTGTQDPKQNLPKVPGKRQIGDGILDGIDGNL
jgi:hypothetical protein